MAAAQSWISGAEVILGSDTYTATQPYYWPKSGYLQVSAVYPASVNASVGDSGIKFTNYTVPAEAAAQEDLLFSDRGYNVVKTKTEEVTNPIPVVFNHALSAINFKVSASTGPNFILKSITLKNIITTGNFDQGLTEENNQVPAANVNSCWTYGDPVATGNYVAPLAVSFATTKLSQNSVYVHNAAEESLNESTLILLPQTLSNATVDIEYTLDGMNQTSSFDLTGSWLRGHRYTYSINFGAEVIEFTATANAWADGSATPPTTTIQ